MSLNNMQQKFEKEHRVRNNTETCNVKQRKTIDWDTNQGHAVNERKKEKKKEKVMHWRITEHVKKYLNDLQWKISK